MKTHNVTSNLTAECRKIVRAKYTSLRQWSVFNTTAYRRTKRCTRMSDFRFPENCALLGYYAACSGNSLPTFRDNISVPFQGPRIQKEAVNPNTTHHQIISKCHSFHCCSRDKSTAIFRFELRVMRSPQLYDPPCIRLDILAQPVADVRSHY